MIASMVSVEVHDRRVRGYSETRIRHDFRRVRRGAFWRGLVNRIRAKQNHLPSISETLAGCTQSVHSDMGYRTVPVAQIAGSVGRSHDFDDQFMPRHEHLRDRWVNINRAYHNNVALPAVELVQVGDHFFVMDGHHRVSVARTHDQHFLDAHVVKIEASCAARP
jgi:hypothetical protein